MIGYYIHHHGAGHLTRAIAVAKACTTTVTGLSSLPRPAQWDGPWIDLPMDDGDAAADVDAHERLHWVPIGSAGLADRMAAVAAWIAATRPTAFVADVSVEVSLLARLHGVPVVTMALPGLRADAAHALGFDVSAAIVAAWPEEATGTLQGLSPAAARRLHPVGAISRFAPEAASAPPGRRVLVLAGRGGDDFTAETVAAAAAATPGWTWRHLGGASGDWVEDPRAALAESAVIVCAAGQSALADVAAARRPAIVVPGKRPFDEQGTTARVLAHGDWPVIVRPALPVDEEWSVLLEQAAALDGGRWARWNNGLGAERAADIVERVARGEIR